MQRLPLHTIVAAPSLSSSSFSMLRFTFPLAFSLVAVAVGVADSLTTTTTSQPYAVNVRFSIHPSRRQEFLDLIRDNQRQTLNTEPAALQYVVGEDVENCNQFYLHEQFRTATGFDKHRDAPHNANWGMFKNSHPFVEKPRLDFFHVESSSSTASADPVPIRLACCVHTELRIDPEYCDEFLQILDHIQTFIIPKEPLCLQYVYGECTTEPDKFVFHEEFVNKDGYEEHKMLMGVYSSWSQFVDPEEPCARDLVVNVFETIPQGETLAPPSQQK